MENRDKVFAQNWIEQMRREFKMRPFLGFAGRPLTYVYEFRPETLVNCFWWNSAEWRHRDRELEWDDLVR